MRRTWQEITAIPAKTSDLGVGPHQLPSRLIICVAFDWQILKAHYLSCFGPANSLSLSLPPPQAALQDPPAASPALSPPTPAPSADWGTARCLAPRLPFPESTRLVWVFYGGVAGQRVPGAKSPQNMQNRSHSCFVTVVLTKV